MKPKALQSIALTGLRLALGASFLSAVASRFGLWGRYGGNWTKFLTYAGEVNWYLPAAMIPFVAVASTTLETTFGILLIAGWQVRRAAFGSAALLMLFALAMFSGDPKSPFDYSVFTASFGALALAVSTTTKRKELHLMTPVQLIRTNDSDWKPLDEPGISGIGIKVLRFDEATKRPPTFLLKFDAGARYPAHDHPAGEEVFVLDGEVTFGKHHLKAGDYLYTPPGGKHAVWSQAGCVMLLSVPEEVVILKELVTHSDAA